MFSTNYKHLKSTKSSLVNTIFFYMTWAMQLNIIDTKNTQFLPLARSKEVRKPIKVSFTGTIK